MVEATLKCRSVNVFGCETVWVCGVCGRRTPGAKGPGARREFVAPYWLPPAVVAFEFSAAFFGRF